MSKTTHVESDNARASLPVEQTVPWEIFEGGNFVRIGVLGYRKWTEKNHYLGGPLKVAEMAYATGEDYGSDHEKAMAYARFIVRAVNSHAALVEALLGVLKIGRGTSGRIIIDRDEEAALREALRAAGVKA